MSADLEQVVEKSGILVIAVPSAYWRKVLGMWRSQKWEGKKVVSAVKGILPDQNILLNYYLQQKFNFSLEDYFAVLGPCHAEEVACRKAFLSYFFRVERGVASEIASRFSTSYINTVVNHDILGVQYAAVLKNIYALGAGIAHGLDYGDNFQSVYIANSADEMAGFLRNSVLSILL
jgi:glycerol-3-phosphate dehydrogenase (NAD(P)+)